MKKITDYIPNTITCVNVAAGTAAVFAAMRQDELWCGLQGYQWAYIFIAIAAVADFLDGLSARLLHAYSETGRELDSLCDLVSFGVAPAVLLYGACNACGVPAWGAWTAVLIPVFGALRLARFNVAATTAPSVNFTGLPIPANAIFWIGFTAWMYELEIISGVVVVVCVLLLSWIMTSRMRLFSLKFRSFNLRDNWERYSLVLACAVCCLTMGVTGLLWTIVYYVCLSAARQRRLARSK